MILWSLGQIKEKVKNDLDLVNETMITDAEMLGYINSSIDECEQLVLTLYEDYLLQVVSLPLVEGQSEYELPQNIYAHKIRKVFYANGPDMHEVKRVRDLRLVPQITTHDLYRYVVLMIPSGEFRLKLYPAAKETSSSNMTVWFLGNANRLVNDSDVMNIPEAAQYIIARTKLECARKEGHPAQVALEQEVANQRQLLVETLTAMVPDENNTIPLDPEVIEDFYPFSW